jgi:Uma2 family endonuclease
MKLKKGLEPDECYYVQHAADVEGKDELDLKKDPPPDLAIEIDITHRSIPRLPIYAALGVPEVWRFDGLKLTVLILGDDGKYRPATSSLAFPFLPMETFSSFLLRLASEPQIAVLREFRDWVKTLQRP